jgi:hypothetical protein
MVLFWHFGVAAAFAVIAGLLGGQVLKWPDKPK